MTWNSTKDRLPEKNGRYLIATRRTCEPIVAHFAAHLDELDPRTFETHRPGWWLDDDEAIWEVRGVTHWMPLPDLPY